MVSNFERILAEIRKEASRVAPTYRLDPESVTKLIMEIVDLEDLKVDRDRPPLGGRLGRRVMRLRCDCAR